jgi:hypothetical protein
MLKIQVKKGYLLIANYYCRLMNHHMDLSQRTGFIATARANQRQRYLECSNGQEWTFSGNDV